MCCQHWDWGMCDAKERRNSTPISGPQPPIVCDGIYILKVMSQVRPTGLLWYVSIAQLPVHINMLSPLVTGYVRCKAKANVHYNFRPIVCSSKLYSGHADSRRSYQPFNPATAESCESQSAIVTEGLNNLLNAKPLQYFSPPPHVLNQISRLIIEQCFSGWGWHNHWLI
jgi:hypothetical protein